MAQNITLLGASYTDVPSVLLPKTGGGTASFTDVTGTTATAADVASGKVFYAADGTQTTGTASGGASWTKIAETTYTASTTSTSATTIASWDVGASAVTNARMVYIRIRDTAGKRAGYFYGSDSFYMGTNGISDICVAKMSIAYSSDSEPVIIGQDGTGGYGIYTTYLYTTGTVTVRKRYNATYSLTVDGTYSVEAYTLDWPDGVSPFA